MPGGSATNRCQTDQVADLVPRGGTLARSPTDTPSARNLFIHSRCQSARRLGHFLDCVCVHCSWEFRSRTVGMKCTDPLGIEMSNYWSTHFWSPHRHTSVLSAISGKRVHDACHCHPRLEQSHKCQKIRTPPMCFMISIL